MYLFKAKVVDAKKDKDANDLNDKTIVAHNYIIRMVKGNI